MNKPSSPPLDAFLQAPPPSPLRHRLSLAVLALAAVAATALFVRFWAGSDSPYYTEPVTRGDLLPVLSARGALHGESELAIVAAQDGVVSTMPLQGRAAFNAGQVLAEMDLAPLLRAQSADRAKQDEARAHLARARVIVADTQTRLERYERVWRRSEGRAPSVNEMETARAAAAVARFDLDAANAAAADAEDQLATDQTRLDGAETRAPFAGQVVARYVHPGQLVRTGQPLLSVAPLREALTVAVPLSRADALRLQARARARVLIDGLPEAVTFAHLSRIEPVRVTDPVLNRADRLAIFSPDQTNDALRPGMSVTAEIDLPSRQNVLLAPDSAIAFCKREVGRDCIALLGHDGETRRIYISVGGGDGKRREVMAAGLEAGAQAVIGWRHSQDGLSKETKPHANP